MALPNTVTTLTCPNGSTVYVVGTAHFSPESVEDVRTTVRQKRPDAVVLELCQNRRLILHFSQEDILREAKTMTFSKMRTLIQREGLVAGAVQSVFLKMSAKLTEQLGVAPGGEFRAGFEEAQKLNCRVMLGDRLVGITFKRALAALSIWQRIRFGYLLATSLTSDFNITSEEVERLKHQDMVQLLTGEFAAGFPPLMEVFIDERDKILAYSLKLAANCAQHPYGPPVTVVGVMGIGHIPGIKTNWTKEMEVQHLMSVPEPSRTSRVVWAGIKLTLGVSFIGLVSATVYYVGKKILCR